VRLAYRLTESGAALAGALRLLSQWGADHPRPRGGAAGAPAEPVHHDACGTAVEARWWCPTCERLVEDDEASDLRWV
jgi:hypothetical protein